MSAVHNVNDAVDHAHEGDHHQFVPAAERAALAGPGAVAKAEQRPDDHGRHVHRRCYDVMDDHKLVEGEGKYQRHPCNGEQDDEDGEGEAQRVDGHAPLQPRGAILAALQRREDEAGEEGLQKLQDAGDGGEEAHGLPPGTKASPHPFGSVHAHAYPRHHRGADLPGAGGAGEEDGVDDGRGEAHEARQHGEGCGEVIPGEGQLAAELGELQDQDQQREEEAEAPGEHAPRPVRR